MKIPERIHRWAEVDADAWIFEPKRADLIYCAANLLMVLAIVSGAIYVSYLVVKAVLFAAANY